MMQKPAQAIGQKCAAALVPVMINPSMNASTTAKIPHKDTLGNAETGTHFALSPAAALEGSPIATPPCTTARACRRVAEATQ